MSGDIFDVRGRGSSGAYPIAELLLAILVTSCAVLPAGRSPTAPAPPSIAAITPILAGTEPPQDPPSTAEPTPTSTVAAATATPTPAPATAPPSSSHPVTHTVQPGDTLLALARLYDVPMAAIQLENDMGGSTILQSGQTIAIPSNERWEDASPFWAVHEVAPGETLIGIARAYGVEVEDVRAVNNLDDADRITIGQRLVLPASAPSAPPTAEPTDLPTATAVPLETPPPSPTASSEAEAPASGSVPSAAEAAPPADLASWPGEIARLINEVRAQHGLPPYRYNQTLEQSAQAHANDCEQRGWCSHVGSDGSRIKARVLRAGYDATGWAECWAQTSSPRKAVEIWMNETPPNDPHRRTLLSDWFEEIGIGVSDAPYGTYIIANFGRP
jgi:uncharacterized protein YkwD